MQELWTGSEWAGKILPFLWICNDKGRGSDENFGDAAVGWVSDLDRDGYLEFNINITMGKLRI